MYLTMRQMALLFEVSLATVCRVIQRPGPLLAIEPVRRPLQAENGLWIVELLRRTGLTGQRLADDCHAAALIADGAYINTDMAAPHGKRPGRPLPPAEEDDNANHRRARVRVEHPAAG